MKMRKAARLLVAAAALLLTGTGAHAQDKPLHIVLGFPAGAGADTVTRLISERMRQILNRPVIVENKTGAGGIIANMTVKTAPPDGSVILMTPLAAMVAYPHSYSKLEYDPFRDYTPVAHVASFALAFGVGAGVPARSLRDYVAYVNGGGDGNFASAATGSLPHFFGIMFARTAGIQLNHISYRGTAAVLQALYAGEIPAAVLPLSDLGVLQQSGKGRILATSGATRAAQHPDVPTFRESGYDIEGSAWYALFAPAGTPADTVDKIARAAIDAARAPDLKQRIEAAGLEATGLGPAELAAILRADYEKWGPVIRASGFKAD